MKLFLKIYQSVSAFLRTHFHTFRSKVMLCFILCAVVPLVIVGEISYSLSYQIAKDKIMETMEFSNRQLVTNLNNRMRQIENVSDSIQYYMYTLDNTPSYPLSAYLDAYDRTKSNISSLGSAFNILHISVFVKPDVLFSKERFSFFQTSDLQKYHVDSDTLLSRGTKPYWKFSANQTFPYEVAPTPLPVLSCFRATMDVRKHELKYAYAISLDCREFSQMFSKSTPESTVTSYLVDPNTGIILAHPQNTKIGTCVNPEELKKIQSHSGVFPLNRSEYILGEVHNGEWVLVTKILDEHINQNTGILVNIILIAILCALVITVTAVIFISRTITKRINLLSNVIKKTKPSHNEKSLEQLAVLLPKRPDEGDEINLLAETFQNMITTINLNFQQILNMSIQEEKLKYQLLQSQINPHFLYNILNSIRSCQSIGKIDIADQMIGDLAKFYRHIMYNPEDLITIQEELKIAELYLRLELQCSNNAFSWKIRADSEIENFLICKFTLQPILENCVLHGIRSAQEHLDITIDISYGDDCIILAVRDNGIGISPEELSEIQKMLAANKINYSKHYGISNVNARLSVAQSGHVEVESELSKGTVVKIIIQQML